MEGWGRSRPAWHQENIIMPIVTVKIFEGELTKDQTVEIIADITEVVIPCWRHYL
jgi:hypothetical protein